MKIVSSFRDYYDNAVGYDSDHTRIYVRDTTRVDYKKGRENGIKKVAEFLEEVSQLQETFRMEDQIEHRIIGFCGKLHLMHSFQEVHYLSSEYDQCCESYLAIARADPANRILISSSRYMRKRFRWPDENGRKSYRECLKMHAGLMMSDQPFLELDAPCFMMCLNRERHRKAAAEMTINPQLRDLRFQRVLDPYRAYQEIDMYIGNQLAKQNDPPSEFTDALKAHAYGFDEWSFRNYSPGPRKTRRRIKRAAD